jgi:hypothetical protein
MRKTTFSLAAILLFTLCVRFNAAEDQTVSFQGILLNGIFYGPINFGKDPATDQLEESFYLQLPNSMDQQLDLGGKHEIAIKERDRTGGCFVQLGATYDLNNDLKPKVGKKVKITGLLFEKYSPRHHTPLMLQVQKVEVIENFAW